MEEVKMAQESGLPTPKLGYEGENNNKIVVEVIVYLKGGRKNAKKR